MIRSSSARRRGLALVAASAALGGTAGTSARLVYDHGGEPLTLLFARSAGGAAIFAAVAVATGGALRSRREVLVGLALGTTLVFGHSMCFFQGVDRAPVSLVVLLFYSYPLLVAVGGALLYAETFTLTKLVALMAGLAGVALAVGPPGAAPPAGVALALGSGIIYAVYVLATKRAVAAAFPVGGLAAALYAGAALDYSAIAAVRGVDFPDDGVGWGALGAVVVLGTVGPVLLLLMGLRFVEASTAAIASTVEPFIAVLIAFAVLGEGLAAIQLVGGALVIAAVTLLALSSGTAAARTQPALE